MRIRNVTRYLALTGLLGLGVAYVWQNMKATSAPVLAAMSVAETGPELRKLPKKARSAMPMPAALVPTDKAGAMKMARVELKPVVVNSIFSPKELAASRANKVGAPRSKSKKVWVKVSGSRVNLRSSPEVRSSRIGSFRRGTRLVIIERKARWSHVVNPATGERGWMHRDYLTPGVTG